MVDYRRSSAFGARRSWRMTREEALQRHPNAEPVKGSMEIRNLPESSAEWQFE
jgi:hypothetical protein